MPSMPSMHGMPSMRLLDWWQLMVLLAAALSSPGLLPCWPASLLPCSCPAQHQLDSIVAAASSLRSAWVSSLAIYNRLLQERPDLVQVGRQRTALT